jgi:hypothetical protein
MTTSAASSAPSPTSASSKRPVLVYLHVYKTGGNSVRELLARTFDGHDFLDLMFYGRCGSDGLPRTVDSPDPYVDEFLDVARAHQHRLTYIAADLPYGVHRHLDAPVWYCATLRHPVERLLSYVRFARRDPKTSIWPFMRSVDFDFGRLVDEHKVYAFANDQVRMLSGSSRLDVGPAELEAAKDNIANGRITVAASDDLDSLRRGVEARFAVTAPDVPRLNTTDPTTSDFLSTTAVDQLRDLNAYDAQLWDWYSARSA